MCNRILGDVMVGGEVKTLCKIIYPAGTKGHPGKDNASKERGQTDMKLKCQITVQQFLRVMLLAFEFLLLSSLKTKLQ